MAKKIYVYMKQGEDFNQIKEIIDKISPNKEPIYDLYTDSDRDYIAFTQLKNDISNNKGILIISSLNNIGSNKSEVFDELIWLKNNRIATIFANYPSTYIFENPIENAMVLNVIIDVYKSLLDNKSFDIRPATAAPTGRKKIGFPENWESFYTAWINKEMPTKEILEKSGLKKGTFYHLLKEYKELLDINKGTLN